MTLSHHIPKKRFGQNFLQDESTIEEIIQTMAPQINQTFLEIGPGEGVVTKVLCPLVQKLYALEIDRDLISQLQVTFADHKNFVLYEADALNFDLHTLATEQARMRVFGNLPYNISSPLLFHLFDQSDVIEDIHIMLQKEVAERLCANPGEDAYGRLSIMTRFYAEASLLFPVEASSFYPVPKVDSAFVKLNPHRHVDKKEGQLLFKVVTQAFSQRRKTIKNALSPLITETQLLKQNIDPKIRPEMLSLEDFKRICSVL